MKTNKRWITSTINETTSLDVKMPWTRGAGRTQWKARVAARAVQKIAKSA